MGTHKIYSGIQGIRDNIWGSLYGDCHELLALLKEQMIIPVQKTLNNAGHIDAKLIHFLKFAEKNPAKSAIFFGLFLGEVSLWNFPWKRPIFLRICPWKSFEMWLFSAKIPRNRPIFCEFWLRLFTFPYFFMRYTASYRHRYLDFQMYRGGGRRGL